MASLGSDGVYEIKIANPDGTYTFMEPKTSLWYMLYVNREPQGKKEKNLFRKRFRLSYNAYKKLLQDIRTQEHFKRWTNTEAVGSPPVPIELLLLGFLRYVGRGFTLDDLDECTTIDGETHRQFILFFIRYGSTIFWEKM